MAVGWLQNIHKNIFNVESVEKIRIFSLSRKNNILKKGVSLTLHDAVCSCIFCRSEWKATHRRMSVYFTYESRETLTSFPLSIAVKKLNLGYGDKFEIEI